MRYSAQRYGTWEWLDFEVPFDTDGPEWALSTYGEMEATVAPEIGLQKAGDGRPVLEEWGTLIHAETGTGISSRRWTGIVVRSELAGKEWRVIVREFPGYLDGTPIETLIRGVNADPANLIRQVWLDVQSVPQSWLNVTVKGSTSVSLGTDSDDKLAAARATMDARKQTLDSLNKTKNSSTKELQDAAATLSDEVVQAREQLANAQEYVTALVKQGAPKEQIETARLAAEAQKTTLKNAQAAYTVEVNAKKSALSNAKKNKDAAQKAYDAARKAYDAAREKAQEDGGAYEIRPEDIPDAADEVRKICEASNVEWTTATKYSDGIPELFINIHYPQAGTTRDDLVFQQGVNILNELELVRDGDEYANSAKGVGAGEGAKAVRSDIAPVTQRMRRVTTIEDRSIKKKGQLTALMRKELKRKTLDPYVSEIEVVDHPLAPLFSWNVGDHITVQGTVPHYGEYSAKHRIVSWQMLDNSRALLRLKLSSTF